ncbi:hypothetical protein NEPAR04_0969 [Nematocida parisii]|nr:hypothetical protein NEPAR08_0792 [Nematocida parisii]KAI5127308.1 hypothetical protein NEPAR03_0912 [Nematocida parisii]KAI5141416.1 hypothetical protein NEPAR04_0969 [Nematocida parisii]
MHFIKRRICAAIILGLMYAKIKFIFVEASSALSMDNTNAHQGQMEPGLSSSMDTINSSITKEKNNIRRGCATVNDSIKKSGKNKCNSNKNVEFKPQHESIIIIKEYRQNFERITGQSLNNYIESWAGCIQKPQHNIYEYIANKDVIKENIFNELLDIFRANNNDPSVGVNKLYNNPKYKFSNLPILSPRASEYYLFVKDNLKNMLNAKNSLINNSSQELEGLKKDVPSNSELANIFVTLIKSPGLYKSFDFRDMLQTSSKQYSHNIVDFSTPGKDSSTINSLKDKIHQIEIKLLNFIGSLFYQIELFLAGHPIFNSNKKRLDFDLADINYKLPLDDTTSNIFNLRIKLIKEAWKFTSNLFIQQMPELFQFLENVSNVQTPDRLIEFKKYLYDNDNSNRIMIRKSARFNLIHKFIYTVKMDIAEVDVLKNDINEMNRISSNIEYLAEEALKMLNFITLDFKSGKKNVDAYKALSNKANPLFPLEKECKEFETTWLNIEKHEKHVQEIAKYVDKYLALADEKRGLSNYSYTINLVKELINVSSKPDNKLLKAINACSSAIKKIFPFIKQ